ncbi:MAG: ABC transporter permease subunit [Bacillota bacterium]
MPLRALFLIALNRIALVLVAGLMIVMLAHIEAGTFLVEYKGVQVAHWSADNWFGNVVQYLKGVAQGDLGTMTAMRVPGYTLNQPVSLILSRFGANSLVLLGAALLISLALGTLLGILSSRFGFRGVRLPALASSLVLISMPDILIIMLLRRLLVFVLSSYGVKLFSLTALGGEVTASHFVAPLLALSALPLGVVARVSAVAFDEVYDQLYIRTAVAKGARPLRVIVKHAMKNAWIRVAESSPLIMSSLVTGLVIVEYVLYFPGIGRTMGLILEHGGRSAAAASIALVLLVGATLIDLLFSAVRLALDPRLAQQHGGRHASFAPGVSGWGLAAPRFDWQGALVALAEWPERARQWLWRNRPSRILRVIGQNPLLLIGVIGVAVLLVTALFGAQFVELANRKEVIKVAYRNGDVIYPPYPPGTDGFPLGSDLAGRSIWSRILIGARYTLFFTLAVTPVRLLLALPWGLAAGLRGGLWAGAGRTAGLVVSALPVLLIPALLLKVQKLTSLRPESAGGFWLITAILAVVGIPRLAEAVRQHVEAVAVQPFVEGARAVGAGAGRILWRHILPHLTPQLWVAAAADMAWTLLLLAQFGVFSIYLGGSVFVATGTEIMGATSSGVLVPVIPDWSSMLSKPYDVIYKAPWALWAPGVAFLFAIISFNLVAEGLRRWTQRMTGAIRREEFPATAPARRRLALEWGAAAAVTLFLLSYTGRYAYENQALQTSAQVQPTLERARLRMNEVLQMAVGKGISLQRDDALRLLPKVVEEFLLHAYKAGMSPAQMEEASQQLLRVRYVEGFFVADVPGLEGPALATTPVFVVDENAASVSTVDSIIRLESVTALPQPTEGRWLILAGKTGDSGHPAVSLWSGPFSSFRYPYTYSWRSAPFPLRMLPDLAPPEYGLRAVGSGPQARLEAQGALTDLAVEPSGNLKLCATDGACTTLRWTGEGWER